MSYTYPSPEDRRRVYRDRREAGSHLSELLAGFGTEGHETVVRPVVLGLARGGVAVAAEVARGLHAPLDAMLVRKLGAPGNPELAIGAVAEGSEALVSRPAVERLEVPLDYVEREVSHQRQRIEELAARYRGAAPPLSLAGRPAILVDDGLATGSTALAAVAAARDRGAARVVFAVPVAAEVGLERIRRTADEAVCPLVPEDLQAVGHYYEDFHPVTDEEVVRLLKEFG